MQTLNTVRSQVLVIGSYSETLIASDLPNLQENIRCTAWSQIHHVVLYHTVLGWEPHLRLFLFAGVVLGIIRIAVLGFRTVLLFTFIHAGQEAFHGLG